MSLRIKPSHGFHELDGDETPHTNIEKLAPVAHRPSKSEVIKEEKGVSVFPKVWSRESLSGYKGRKVLGIDGDEKPMATYAPESKDVGKHDYSEYELPQRYGGKGPTYSGDIPLSMSRHNHSWAPRKSRELRFCGLKKWMFWLIIIVICLVVLCAVIGGMVVGVESSARRSAAAKAESYMTSIEISSEISTMTNANGVVVVSTQVFTSMRTFKPSTTTSQSSETNKAVTASASSANSKATTSSSSLASNRPSSTPPTSSVKPSSTPTVNPGIILPLACPLLNGSTASTSISSRIYTYTILCNTDFHSGGLYTVNASSLSDCYNACATYSHLQVAFCTGAVFYANLSSLEGKGNCELKNDIKMSYTTTTTNLVAAAVLTGGQGAGGSGGGGSLVKKEKKWVGPGLKTPLV